tara:strand:+ start:331 stop:732 length:402 start_codon:yes stop_codon:yes gene_type:complete
MKRIVALTAVIMLSILSVVVSKSFATQETKNIVVEIDYGNLLPSRTIETPRVEGKTALEVLQAVAKVETYTVDGFTIVVSIDGIEGKRGDMAWYYSVDGTSADRVPNLTEINDATHMKWVYKKDTCSEKVDKI